MATYRSNAGFTLIELMVGLAVAGILVTIGTSVSTTYSMQRTFHQQVTWFGGQLTYARSVARMRSVQVDVRVKPSTTGIGQIVEIFEDNNGNGVYDQDKERSLLPEPDDPPRLNTKITVRAIQEDGSPEPFSDAGTPPSFTVRFDYQGRCLVVPDPSGDTPEVSVSPTMRRIFEFAYDHKDMPTRLRVEVSSIGVVSYPLPP